MGHNIEFMGLAETRQQTNNFFNLTQVLRPTLKVNKQHTTHYI